jgi:two-component sensor histidine kinase
MTQPRLFREGRRGLLLHLIGLVTVIVLPAISLGIFAAREVAGSYRSAFETQLVAVARSVASSLDEALDAHLALGRILAASPTLRAGDIDAFEAEARAAGETLGTWVSLVGPGPEYRRFINTALPPGVRPSYGGLVAPPDRAPIPRAFATGQQIVTNVGMAIGVGRPTALILSPVSEEGSVKQLIGIGFEPTRVARVLQAQRLTGPLVATVVDGYHKVLARSEQHDAHVGQDAPEWHHRTLAAGHTGVVRARSSDGNETLATVVPLSRAPWSVAVATPAATADAALTQPLLLLLGGGALLFAIAAALAVWLAQRIVLPISRLAEAASRSSDQGAPVDRVPPAPIAEIEVLRLALLRAEAASRERRARDQADALRQRLLTAELSHRVKNALSVVQAALRLTRRDDPHAYAKAIEGRVAALARANTMLAESDWQGAALEGLVSAELKPFIGGDAGPRVLVFGPPVTLAPTAVQPLAIAVHELATNAVKYGALSIPDGTLEIRWSATPDGDLLLSWSEGGLSLEPPRHAGFGTRVLEATLETQIGGEIQRDWSPHGLRCVIRLPAKVIEARRLSQLSIVVAAAGQE